MGSVTHLPRLLDVFFSGAPLRVHLVDCRQACKSAASWSCTICRLRLKNHQAYYVSTRQQPLITLHVACALAGHLPAISPSPFHQLPAMSNNNAAEMGRLMPRELHFSHDQAPFRAVLVDNIPKGCLVVDEACSICGRRINNIQVFYTVNSPGQPPFYVHAACASGQVPTSHYSYNYGAASSHVEYHPSAQQQTSQFQATHGGAGTVQHVQNPQNGHGGLGPVAEGAKFVLGAFLQALFSGMMS